jgi:hypothetical protein
MLVVRVLALRQNVCVEHRLDNATRTALKTRSHTSEETMRTFIIGAIVALCLIGNVPSARFLATTQFLAIANAYDWDCPSTVVTGGIELNRATECNCPPRIPAPAELPSFDDPGATIPITTPRFCSPIDLARHS